MIDYGLAYNSLPGIAAYLIPPVQNRGGSAEFGKPNK